jgi:hypothetical protein
MIKLNELRIGNWVEFDGKAIKVECIDKKNGWLNYPIKKGNFEYLITESSLQPIPITKEILVWCQFTNIKDHFFELKIGTGCYWHKIYAGVKDLNEGYGNFAELRVGDETIGNFVNFLHELQNLFFALTGKNWLINLCY